jgi:hypothetical protein
MWEQTTKAGPQMSGKKGVVSWNTATHLMLGSPTSVVVYVDAETGRIGFQGVNYLGHLRVEYAGHVYSIDATAELAALKLPTTWKATPALLPDGDSLPNESGAGAGEICIDMPVQAASASSTTTRKRKTAS